MMHVIALWFIEAMAIVTFLLELWTGCAIAGWSGDNAIIRREKSPGPYWFVMTLQAVLLIGINVVRFWGLLI